MIEVNKAWDIVVEEEASDANAEITRLPLGQRKVLKYIANQSGENVMSAEGVKTMGIALSSISGAINGLLEKDIIEKQSHDGIYIIVNPIIKHILVEKNY